jgi:hypothetical protein
VWHEGGTHDNLKFIGGRFKIGEAQNFTRIGRPTNRATWYIVAGDKNFIYIYIYIYYQNKGQESKASLEKGC